MSSRLHCSLDHSTESDVYCRLQRTGGYSAVVPQFTRRVMLAFSLLPASLDKLKPGTVPLLRCPFWRLPPTCPHTKGIACCETSPTPTCNPHEAYRPTLNQHCTKAALVDQPCPGFLRACGKNGEEETRRLSKQKTPPIEAETKQTRKLEDNRYVVQKTVRHFERRNRPSSQCAGRRLWKRVNYRRPTCIFTMVPRLCRDRADNQMRRLL